MSRTPFYLSEALATYVADHTDPPEPELAAVIAETADLAHGEMQVAAGQARFLGMLVQLMGATRILEIGSFTGLSALAMARHLPPGGRLVACDVSEEWTSIARRHWDSAGVGDRIELRIGPALETLETLGKEHPAPFDMAFIDADKESYGAYLDAVVPLLRPAGLIVADNTLRAGRVVEPAVDDPNTAAMRVFNSRAVDDERVETLLLPVFDGLTLMLKR